ncbi:hypothetical protein QNA08_02930 [Chelatococcus sp. SYSU_G07232]|uniref:Uncharacterized protein n=1 Tax=Chelatococcus albus TaxID=3047466 RepID=A0ABT7ACY2_9HYPH|nr:hypothetical protein [Chelatococcus sp. SYSU_G07232]MDJ1157193.1 hypothetical protein [Chelatococcus sp. SYSU_G07232]
MTRQSAISFVAGRMSGPVLAMMLAGAILAATMGFAGWAAVGAGAAKSTVRGVGSVCDASKMVLARGGGTKGDLGGFADGFDGGGGGAGGGH